MGKRPLFVKLSRPVQTTFFSFQFLHFLVLCHRAECCEILARFFHHFWNEFATEKFRFKVGHNWRIGRNGAIYPKFVARLHKRLSSCDIIINVTR